jgi:ABC-2 type transport system permease protein
MSDGLRRFLALTKKEFLELLRDRSSLLMGIALPIMLVFLIGYGISLDVYHSRITVVMEDMSPTAHDVGSFLDGSEFFDPVYITNMKEAVDSLDDQKTEAILRVPPDFSDRLYEGNAHLQLIINGNDTTTAMSIQGYVESGVSSWVMKQMNARGMGTVSIESRIWFNDANTSTWYLMPGLIMLIITLIGVLLTAIVMAREYERGTFESLFVTPVKPMELIISKIIPYFCIAMLGISICFVLSRYLFGVPMMGSLLIIIVLSILYLFIALGAGLIISVTTKSQFLSCQIALIVSLMPCIMLSGYVFDLRSTPIGVQIVGEILPFSHYLTCLKSLFLAGNIWNVLISETIILIFYVFLLLGIAFAITKKKVE